MSRKEITPEESKQASESPAGDVELKPEDLGAVAGGEGEDTTEHLQTWGCCGGVTDNAGTCFPCTAGSACNGTII
jgi:hypothetical protein